MCLCFCSIFMDFRLNFTAIKLLSSLSSYDIPPFFFNVSQNIIMNSYVICIRSLIWSTEEGE